MKWTKASNYHMKSDCGRFHVTAYRVRGEWVYQAIRLPGTVLCVGAKDACMKACEGVANG